MGNCGDISIVHPDGTVTTIYDRAKSESFSYWSGGGETSPQAWIEHTTTSGSHPEATTSYYLADQINSTRMVLAYGGWPVAGGTYYPFGVEIGSSASPNHYKFSGKNRDQASGLDDFGARYYSSVMGRFMTPDWSASPEPVPCAKLDNPQSLNLYSYVENNPLTGIDADGHCDGLPANGTVSDPNGGTQFRSAENPCPSVAKAKVAIQHLTDTVDNFLSSAGVANVLGKAGTFSSGAADVMTFGLTKKINEMDGRAAFIDYKSKTYTAGKVAGITLGAATALGGSATAAAVADGRTGAYFGRGTATVFNGRPGGASIRFGWGWDQNLGKSGKDVIRLAIGEARGKAWYSHWTFWIP